MPDQTAIRFEARTLDSPELKQFLEVNLKRDAFQWPLPTWDLDALTLVAFYYHPSLKVARAEWGVAKAAIITAGGRPNPTVAVTPGYNFTPIDVPSPWFPAITFDVPIETVGKRRYRIAQAKHLSESVRLNIASAAWQVRSQVRANLIELSTSRQRERMLRRASAIQQQVVGALEQRRQLGALSVAETMSARLLLQKLQLDWNEAQKQRTDAGARLAEAVGIPIAALENAELQYDFEHLPGGTDIPDLAELRRQALLGRADVLGAMSDYAASQSALQLEIAKQYPDLHLGPGYQFDQGEHKWQLGLSMELPLLNRNQGPIAEADARRTAAAARFDALQARIIGEIDRALAGYRVAEKTVADTETLHGIQQKQEELQQQQVNVGAADLVDLLATQLELVTSEVALLDSRTKLHQSLGGIEEGVQRPFELPQTLFDSHARNQR